MKTVTKPIKSASLIIARSKQSQTSFFDYELLMMKRKVRPPWGAILVFPGGVYDKQYDNPLQQRFNLASNLQATAIRQVFQQTGLYFTKDPILQTQKLAQLSKLRLQYIKNTLSIVNKPDYKLSSRTIIQKLGQIFPPKSHLLPFLRLITIQQLPKRYDATFYLHKLQDLKYINFLKYAQHEKYIHQNQKIIKCQNEFQQFRWMNPSQILNEFLKKNLSLAPPQYMMINVMSHYKKYYALHQFLSSSYIPKDTYGNISLGPNIISLLPTPQSQYKYAATMIGDRQFPYRKYIETQVCQQTKDQIMQWEQNVKESKVNRFLFNQNQQFFQHPYAINCDIPRYNLRTMMDYNTTKKMLQDDVL